MRADLASFTASLPKARTLASLANDVPRVVHDPQTPEATAVAIAAGPLTDAIGTHTQTIPQAPRRRRGRRLVLWLVVLVTIAAAAYGAWTYLIPHSHPVPSLVGTNVNKATDQLHDLGFTVVVAEGEYNEQPAGTVLRVDPPEGTTLREGSTVTLVPSNGPPPVAVPTVTGLSLDKAVAKLDAAHLAKGAVHQVYDDQVPQGDVVRQSPADGKAPQGSAVDLWVSKGHAPVPVPAVVGKSQQKAERALKAAGFTPVVSFAFSNDIARGKVISVDPQEATKTPYGSPVTIQVSQGPESFAAPRFTGLSPEEATSLAKRYGLHVSLFEVPGTPHITVIGQNPAAGTTVHYGDTVTLYVA
jgi:serine/threonine-protein kinase